MIKDQIDADLKKAMLSGDKDLTTILRTIKSSILDAEITAGVREKGLPEDSVISLLQKEVKKRLDAAKMYTDANEAQRAENEDNEAQIIKNYLPKMMSEEEVSKIVEEIISDLDQPPNMAQMGQIIGATKAKTGLLADGSLIAKIVKERIAK